MLAFLKVISLGNGSSSLPVAIYRQVLHPTGDNISQFAWLH